MPLLYQYKTAVLGTMHQKEAIIAPILRDELELNICVPKNFDTDQYGTFTRDVSRQGNQLDCARIKALAAMSATGCSIGLASEGSFGTHPYIPYVPGNIELIIFIDQDLKLEIVGEAVSAKTNYRQHVAHTIDEAYPFMDSIGFPEHGLVAIYQYQGETVLQKGIQDVEILEQILKEGFLRSDSKTVTLETDMRAHCNPTRQTVIRQAAIDLAYKVKNTCPQCETPGFTVFDTLPGKLCEWCRQPTECITEIIYACSTCNYRQSKPKLDPPYANPKDCVYCNP